MVRISFLIHTWLQPGVLSYKNDQKPFKRFPILIAVTYHLAKARCE